MTTLDARVKLLIERLTGYNPPDRTISAHRQTAADILEAADLIRELQAKASVEHLQRHIDEQRGIINSQTEEILAVCRERDALREMVDLAYDYVTYDQAWSLPQIWCERARSLRSAQGEGNGG